MRRSRQYVRFVCYQLVDGQRQRLGVFQALDAARDSEVAPDWALAELGDCRGWFRDNLSIPSQFARGGWKGVGQPGLSWFKSWAADEHIKRMFRMKLALEDCGVHVEVLTTRDPGLIIYEDKHQVVAEPGGRRF